LISTLFGEGWWATPVPCRGPPERLGQGMATCGKRWSGSWRRPMRRCAPARSTPGSGTSLVTRSPRTRFSVACRPGSVKTDRASRRSYPERIGWPGTGRSPRSGWQREGQRLEPSTLHCPVFQRGRTDHTYVVRAPRHQRQPHVLLSTEQPPRNGPGAHGVALAGPARVRALAPGQDPRSRAPAPPWRARPPPCGHEPPEAEERR